MKILLSMLIVLGTVQVHAGALSEEAYQTQLKKSYDRLQQQELQLKQAMQASQHHLEVIEKACNYAKTLHGIRQLSSSNRHLTQAQAELTMVNELNRNINYSFRTLGTSYGQSCQSV